MNFDHTAAYEIIPLFKFTRHLRFTRNGLHPAKIIVDTYECSRLTNHKIHYFSMDQSYLNLALFILTSYILIKGGLINGATQWQGCSGKAPTGVNTL